MGIYGDITGSKMSEGGIYVLPGVYRFELLACKHVNMRTGKQAFVAELRVLESTNPQRMPGSTCSWMVTLDQEPALGNIKAFIMAAAPCKEEQVSEDLVLLVIGEKNPLKGRIVRASAVNIKTKRGSDFTKVKWMEDSTDAAAVEQTATA